MKSQLFRLTFAAAASPSPARGHGRPGGPQAQPREPHPLPGGGRRPPSRPVPSGPRWVLTCSTRPAARTSAVPGPINEGGERSSELVPTAAGRPEFHPPGQAPPSSRPPALLRETEAGTQVGCWEDLAGRLEGDVCPLLLEGFSCLKGRPGPRDGLCERRRRRRRRGGGNTDIKKKKKKNKTKKNPAIGFPGPAPGSPPSAPSPPPPGAPGTAPRGGAAVPAWQPAGGGGRPSSPARGAPEPGEGRAAVTAHGGGGGPAAPSTQPPDGGVRRLGGCPNPSRYPRKISARHHLLAGFRGTAADLFFLFFF